MAAVAERSEKIFGALLEEPIMNMDVSLWLLVPLRWHG